MSFLGLSLNKKKRKETCISFLSICLPKYGTLLQQQRMSMLLLYTQKFYFKIQRAVRTNILSGTSFPVGQF